jgi:hypothetical protein
VLRAVTAASAKLCDPRSVNQADSRVEDFRNDSGQHPFKPWSFGNGENAQLLVRARIVEITGERSNIRKPTRVGSKELREKDGRHMSTHDLRVRNTKLRRSHIASDDSLGPNVVVEIMWSAATICNCEAWSPAAPARSADSLRVVEWLGRHIPEENHIQVSEVNA